MDIFKQGNKVAYGLITLASSVLTDMVYNDIIEAHYEGKMQDNTMVFTTINKYSTLERICIILIIFVLLWIVLSYIIPFVFYYLDSKKKHNKPKIDTEKVISTYEECKYEVKALQDQAHQVGDKTDSYYTILFLDACLTIQKMYKVFCIRTKRNDSIIENSFRTGATINDLDLKISLYEYYALLDVLERFIETAYLNIPNNTNKSFLDDYTNIKNRIKDLYNLPI